MQKLIYPLVCHPAHPSAAQSVDVSVEITSQRALQLCFNIRGSLTDIAIPSPRFPAPADNLWRHTCCEAFIALAGQQAYQEFNFSPSGQSAAYRFTSYREKSDAAYPVADPEIKLRVTNEGLRLEAQLATACLPDKTPGAVLQIGLSAVIEASDQSVSYWALRHPAGVPDFHCSDNFLLELDWAD